MTEDLHAQHEEIDGLCERLAHTPSDTLLDELAAKLAHHLDVEQELLFPVISHTLSPEVMTELLAEHVAIKRVLGKLLWLGVHDDDMTGLLDRLRELLAGHAAWQEDQPFACAVDSVLVEHVERAHT
jgi:hypothetical protein